LPPLHPQHYHQTNPKFREWCFFLLSEYVVILTKFLLLNLSNSIHPETHESHLALRNHFGKFSLNFKVGLADFFIKGTPFGWELIAIFLATWG